MPPLFRLSFLLELPRPSTDPNPINQDIALDPPDDQNHPKTSKQGIRQHPQFSLRVTALIALSLGIILNAVIYSTYGRQYYTVRQLTGAAEIIMPLSLLHHLLLLYHPSLLPHTLPPYLLPILETLGFLLFGTLFGFNVAAIAQMLGPYYRSEAAVLLAYDSGVWVVCLIVHAIIIAQCIAHRSRPRSSCASCAHHPSPNPNNTADEEETLLGPEAAPESSLPQEYRDEEIEDSTAHA